jgi:hypothetical protein
MEVSIRTNEIGSGSTVVVHDVDTVVDATITRGWGKLTVVGDHSGTTISVTNAAPNDAVGLSYADGPGHQLTCPFCLTPLKPHVICDGPHRAYVRPFHIHHEATGTGPRARLSVSERGHEQAAAARARYTRQRLVN